MVDLLGFGSNAPNVVTNRPADNRIFGGPDTYAKDCSSPNAGDGTGIFAAWGNAVLGQLRALIRGNGQTAGLADIVPVDNSDDTMALKAILQLIQRGQMSFGVDTGAANALVVAFNPPLAEYKGGASLRVLVLHDNDGPANINANGLGLRQIVRRGGRALQPGDLPAGGIVTLNDDGARFQIDLPAGYSNAASVLDFSADIIMDLVHRALGMNRSAPVLQNITLPAGAENGHEVVIEDVKGNFQPAPVTVLAPAGETIAGAAQYVMNVNFQSTLFRFYTNGALRIWSRT